MIGAIKIKDGLFIGDKFAAQVKQILKMKKHICSRKIKICSSLNNFIFISFNSILFIIMNISINLYI